MKLYEVADILIAKVLLGKEQLDKDIASGRLYMNGLRGLNGSW